MIYSFELLSRFYRHHITDIFNDTDLIMVSTRVTAYAALCFVREIVTSATELNVLLHIDERSCESFYS